MTRATSTPFADSIRQRPLAIYGAGQMGRAMFDFLREQGRADQVICFVDADSAKWGQSIEGRPVERPDHLPKLGGAVVIIAVGTAERQEEIHRRLSDLVDPGDLFSSPVFFDQGWLYLTGFFDEPPFGTGWSSDRVFPSYAALSSRPPRDPELFRAVYDLDDEYTTLALDFFLALTSPHLGEAPAIIQPWRLCRHLAEMCPTNEVYWGEAMHLTGQGPITMVDIGSSVGHTLGLWFLLFGERIRKIHAFEPHPLAWSLCDLKVRASAYRDLISLYKLACGDRNTDQGYLMNPAGTLIDCNLAPGQEMEEVLTRRLDDLDLEVRGRLFMKLDVEGFELEVLAGAQEMIARHRPDLAVCVYHKTDHVRQVPEYLKSLVPDYKFILRGGAHMVCYASARH